MPFTCWTKKGWRTKCQAEVSTKLSHPRHHKAANNAKSSEAQKASSSRTEPPSGEHQDAASTRKEHCSRTGSGDERDASRMRSKRIIRHLQQLQQSIYILYPRGQVFQLKKIQYQFKDTIFLVKYVLFK